MPRRQICDRLPCEESDSHSESTKMKMNFINNSRDHIILERSCHMKTLVEKYYIPSVKTQSVIDIETISLICLRSRQAPVPTPLETIPMPRRQICGRPPCEESDSSFREYKDEEELQQQQPGSYDFRTILLHKDSSREVVHIISEDSIHLCLRRRQATAPTPIEKIPMPRRQICGRPPCEESDSSFREYKDEEELQQQQPGSYDFRTILLHKDSSREVVHIISEDSIHLCLRRRQAPAPTPIETIPMPRRQICGRPPCEESDSSFREYKDEEELQQQQPGSYDFRTILLHKDSSREVWGLIASRLSSGAPTSLGQSNVSPSPPVNDGSSTSIACAPTQVVPMTSPAVSPVARVGTSTPLADSEDWTTVKRVADLLAENSKLKDNYSIESDTRLMQYTDQVFVANTMRGASVADCGVQCDLPSDFRDQ
ncbi:hypothetical protein J6590_095780 [Homalodisca vitripennis]|nr:hypothetical protein J6590_095780 [Homalodisca vitripennis]